MSIMPIPPSLPTVSFRRMPEYPVMTTIPYNYRDVNTFLEKIEWFIEAMDKLIESDNAQSEAYGKLIKDANEAIESTLQSVAELTRDYRALLDEMKAELAAQLAQVEEKLTILQNLIIRVENANEVTARLAQEFKDRVNTFTIIVNALNERVAAVEAEAAKHVRKDELVINVKDYGVKGDGVTDDTAAINEVAQLAGRFSRLWFPEGTYLIKGTVTQAVGQTWTGSGYSQDIGANTAFKYDNTAGSAIIGGVAGVFENAIIVGPGYTNVGTVGLDVRNNGGYMFRNSCIRHFDTAIKASSMWYGHFERSYLYQNKLAMHIEYCYNFTLFDMRIHSALPNGAVGNCLYITDRSMVTLHGGSIEAYQTGIKMFSYCSLVMYGVYMETGIGKEAIGLNLRDWQRGHVMMDGMQIYIQNHRSFVDFSTASNGTFISRGNRIKGGTPGLNSSVYRWVLPVGALRVFIMGDFIGEMISDASQRYISDDQSLPSGSFVMNPYGEPHMADVLLTSMDIKSTRWIKPGHGASYPNRPEPGSLWYDNAKGKLAVFNGSRWVDTLGGAL